MLAEWQARALIFLQPVINYYPVLLYGYNGVLYLGFDRFSPNRLDPAVLEQTPEQSQPKPLPLRERPTSSQVRRSGLPVADCSLTDLISEHHPLPPDCHLPSPCRNRAESHHQPQSRRRCKSQSPALTIRLLDSEPIWWLSLALWHLP